MAYETRQPECYAAVTVTLIAAAITLALRFVARKLKRISLSYDDYLIIVAFIAALVYDAAEYKWLELGLGLHIEDLPYSVEEIVYYCSLFQWIMEHAYTFSIAASQLSLIALYWRAFDSITSVRIAIIGLACFSSTWFLCRAKWDKSIKGHCTIDTGKFFFGTVATHLIIDICMMVLPACLIGSLQLPLTQKVSISAMFMFGIVVCMCSIMMILEGVRYDTNSDDLMWLEVGPANWSAVEINLSIITACLPLMRPIFRYISSGFQSDHSRARESRSQSYKLNKIPTYGQYGRARSQSSRELANDDDAIEESPVIYGSSAGPATNISAGKSHVQHSGREVGADDGIRITNDMDFKVSRVV